MTINKIFSKLRTYNKKNYIQLVFCITLSIMLITSFSVMLYNPTVQNTLPVGGDSRKLVYMIFAIAIIGCLIFIIYAAGLFFKHKSKETGVFLALGTSKSRLKKALLVEMTTILSGCIVAGIILGGISSYIIWQIFLLFLENSKHTQYQLAFTGYGLGLGFSIAVVVFVMGMAVRYMKRTNLMDILYDQRKSEPLKNVSKKYGAAGFIFMIGGLLLGYVVPQIAGGFGKLLPAIWNVTYLLSLVGIYMILVYVIVRHERGKNPQKYYKHIISNSLMKFQGRQTVRNMCILTFLIAGGLYACFFAPGYIAGFPTIKSNPIDFAIPYKMSAEAFTKEEIFDMANEYGVEITKYDELVFSELIGSGIERDWDDDGNLVEEYYDAYRYSEFIDESTYEQLTGNEIDVEAGSYYLIVHPVSAEGFWQKYDDLDLLTNPITKEKLKVVFAGTTTSQPLVRNGVDRYVLNDTEYAAIGASLPKEKQVKQILFNVKDVDASYEFSKALYEEILNRASKEMAVMTEYDEYQEQKALANGENYFAGRPMELTVGNPDLMDYWKYYPTIKILILKTFVQNFAVFFLVFLYVALICLAAVGVIGYTRSVTIGLNNKQLFDDLKKLGANHKYITRCITSQLRKIFVLPTIIGSIFVYSFTLMMSYGNDGIVSSQEVLALGIDTLIVIGVCMYQYMIYRMSLKKIKTIIEIAR